MRDALEVTGAQHSGAGSRTTNARPIADTQRGTCFSLANQYASRVGDALADPETARTHLNAVRALSRLTSHETGAQA